MIQTGTIFNIHIEEIEVVHNFRKSFIDIEELAESILSVGQLEPVQVFYDESCNKFILHDGERRYRAIKHINTIIGVEMSEIKCVIIPNNITRQSLLLQQIVSGEQKQKLNHVEIADALLFVKTEFDMTNDQLGKSIGKSRQWVDHHIKLSKCTEDVKRQVIKGLLTYTQAIGLVHSSLEKEEEKQRFSIIPEKTDANDEMSGILPTNKKAFGQDEESTEKLESSIDREEAIQDDRIGNPEINDLFERSFKNLAKLEVFGKSMSDQGQSDFDRLLDFLRKDLFDIKDRVRKKFKK